MLGALLVLLERPLDLRLLGHEPLLLGALLLELLAQGVDVDTHRLELIGEHRDPLLGGLELGHVGRVVRLLLLVSGIELVVLAELRLPLVFGVAATGGQCDQENPECAPKHGSYLLEQHEF